MTFQVSKKYVKYNDINNYNIKCDINKQTNK